MSAALRPDDLVLVTGGSGFLGSAVVRALIARGSRVRAFVRSSSPPDNLAGLGCEIVAGDLTDRKSLAAALRDVRYLFHVAADYRFWAPDPSVILRVNVEGTSSLMREALSAGVERIVYTSSVAALKVAGATSPVDETSPLAADEAIGAYKRSKTLAERAVEAMILRDNLPAIIVNPTTPIGPRDIRPTPTGRILLDAARGRIPAFVDTGLNFAHVDDIAEGHLLAFERGRIGERYILGGENVLLHELLAAIAGFTGRRAPRLKLPRRPLFPLAFAAEAIARLTGKEPLLTVDGLRLARYRMFFTSAKAERELGYRSRPYQEGVADALTWFRKAGYLT
jgi:dihydroflavonol-4-reductase